MLHGVKALRGFSIAASDGALGSIKDVYFDDVEWTIRYIVVETGGWLSGRNVVISPRSIAEADWPNKAIRVTLSKQQVEQAPGIDTAKPVSRQHEAEFDDYYGFPYYWAGPYAWGATPFPVVGAVDGLPGAEDPAARDQRERERAEADPHLRSADEVIGYHIHAADDSVGHVENFLFDDQSWRIELMVVDTRNWWPGKHVLISPRRIESVGWERRIVSVNITREQVEGSPEYDSLRPPQGTGEHDLYRHFAWPPQW